MICKEYLKDENVKISQRASQLSDEQHCITFIEIGLKSEKL
jgi:hypothetical protein